jgi:hypothetical protein
MTTKLTIRHRIFNPSIGQYLAATRPSHWTPDKDAARTWADLYDEARDFLQTLPEKSTAQVESTYAAGGATQSVQR